VQHNDVLPLPEAGGATWNRMSQFTDIAGTVQATKDATYCYGPYLMKIPVNQFNDLTTVRVEAGGSTAGANTHGWTLQSDTGVFQADDTAAHAAL